MEKKTVTVYDIAKEAGVSTATVSRVLTGNASVKEDKRIRVLEVMEKYNFQPNALARSLFRKETKTIGMILPDVTNPFFSTLYMKTDKCALKHGYTMMLCNSMSNRELESHYLMSMAEKRVDALIFVGGRVNDINISQEQIKELQNIADRIPLVLINGVAEALDCYKITTDEQSGMEKLVDYLLSLGHRKIGMLGGTSDITSSIIKRSALKNALNKREIELKEDYIITGDFSIESGKYSMKALIDKKDRPTAVIAINDFVAIGAIKIAEELGLKVPDDISITGFDDTYLSEIISPELTTVSHNYELIGNAAIDTIVTAISTGDTQKERLIPTELVIRKSCKKID